jgi:N-methylhydantoinase A
MQALFLHGEELNSPVLAKNMATLVHKGFAEAETLCRNRYAADIDVYEFLNLRYQGQSYELCIPYEKNFIELFHQAHEHNFNYRLQDTPLELISIQCSLKINRKKQALPRQEKTVHRKIERLCEQPVYFEHTPVNVPVFKRADMAAGLTLSGPALIVDNYTTILLPASFSLAVDEFHNLIIQGS